MTTEQLSAISYAKTGLKRVITTVESDLGVEMALPITMPVLRAIQACDGLVKPDSVAAELERI